MKRVIALGLAAAAAVPTAAQDEPPFADEIAAFEAADAAAFPAVCRILFVGSSSFERWDAMAEDLAPRPVINRGFGGSEMWQLNAYFDRIVAPYRPAKIVIYEGENDIHNGRSAEAVAADVAAFMDLKTAALGETPVYFISIKVSKQRWLQRPEQIRANAMIEAMAEARSDLAFIDVATAMLDEDGLPRDIYVADQLHMTADGYAIWIPILTSALDAPAESEAPGC